MIKRIVFLSFYACMFFIHVHCQSTFKSIKGEGSIVKQEISLGALQGINLHFSGDVILVQGSPQKIVLEGQQNILDNIEREVKNGIWDISFDRNVSNAEKVKVHITLPSLKEVSLSGSGSVTSGSRFGGLDNFSINVAGSGNVVMDYDASVTDVNLSGSGKVNLSGRSPKLNISISGSGDVAANELITDQTAVSIAGSGGASVHANNNLEANIAGSGDIHYSGNAKVNSTINGSGNVRKSN